MGVVLQSTRSSESRIDGNFLPQIMQELIQQGHEPYTVTRHVHITADIVDAQYVLVTPAAAEIYGLESPDQLIGTYLSQTLMSQDYMRGVLYAVARHHRIRVNAPVNYATRIVRPDNEIVGVKKNTIQLMAREGTTYWITKLELVREFDVPKPVTAEELKLTPQMVYDWAGVASVAEAQKRICSSQNTLHDDRTSGEYAWDVQSNHATSSSRLPESTVEFVSKSGKIRKLRICQKCRYPWLSKETRPRSCPSCHDNNWDKEYVKGPRAEDEVDTWKIVTPTK